MTDELTATANRLGIKLGGTPARTEPPAPRDWKRSVQEAADRVASEAWADRDVPGELERADAVRRLVREQVADDVFNTGAAGQRDRVGTRYVGHHDKGGDLENFSPMFPPRTEEDKALEVEMESVMQENLDGEERVILNLAYDNAYTERMLALMYSTSQPTMHRRIKAIEDKIRNAMLKRYGLEGL